MKCCLKIPTKWVVFSSHPVSPSVFSKLHLLYLSSEWFELHLFVKAPLSQHVKKVWNLSLVCSCLQSLSPSLSHTICVCVSLTDVFFFPLWNENEFAAGSGRYDRSRISGYAQFYTQLPSNDVWMWNCLSYACLRPPYYPLLFTHTHALFFSFSFIASE